MRSAPHLFQHISISFSQRHSILSTVYSLLLLLPKVKLSIFVRSNRSWLQELVSICGLSVELYGNIIRFIVVLRDYFLIQLSQIPSSHRIELCC